jgi:hypothetical protein
VRRGSGLSLREEKLAIRKGLVTAVAIALAALAGCDNATRESKAASCEPLPLVAAPAAVRYIYMASDGSDANSGAEGTPVATFNRVQEILRAERPDSNVVVRIRSDRGVYNGQSVVWSYFDGAHSIVFESWPDTVLATFSQGERDSVFFMLQASAGRPTYLHFRRLRIEGYAAGAIWLAGDAARESGWNGGNSIVDCVMEEIGNVSQPERPIAWAVIDFVNSRHNVIRGCAFIECANANTNEFPSGMSTRRSGGGASAALATGAQGGPMLEANQPIVGVYLAHHSGCNLISGCTFDAFKGDAVRFRDDSNGNEISYCAFHRTGWNAVCTAWFLYPEAFAVAPAECPSWSNTFHHNRAEGN